MRDNDLDDAGREELQTKLHDAVASVLQAHDGTLTNRVLVIAEVIEEDGDPSMWMGVSPGTKTWHSYGMLRFALAVEDAEMVAQEIR